MPTFQNQKDNSSKAPKDEPVEAPPSREITGETLSLQAVENFFKYTINPHLIETKIEKTTAAMMKERGGININLIFAIGVVVVCAGIGYSMISNQSQISDMTNKYITCENSLAQKSETVVNNPAITTTTQPVIPISLH
jgi:hypothetical protein